MKQFLDKWLIDVGKSDPHGIRFCSDGSLQQITLSTKQKYDGTWYLRDDLLVLEFTSDNIITFGVNPIAEKLYIWTDRISYEYQDMKPEQVKEYGLS